jgi:glycosyltransferase involved in cell wall biosynthesis
MKTSIILPVYNGAEFISETIDSILVQSGNWELIIMDDCSTDKTKEIVTNFISSNIFYYSNSENLGVMETMNRAISYAKGDFIRLFSHDDIMLENDLSSNLNYLINNPDIGICFSNHLKIDEFGNSWGDSSIDEKNRNELLPKKIKNFEAAKYLFKFGCISGTQSNITIRRNVLLDYKFNPNMKYVGDFYFLATAGIIYGIGYNTDLTCKVRFHKNNTSRLGDNSISKMIEISYITKHLLNSMQNADFKFYSKRFSSIYGYQYQKIVFKNIAKLEFKHLQTFIKLFGFKNFISSFGISFIKFVKAKFGI